MNGALTIGPLALPWGLVVVLAAAVAAWGVGRVVGRRAGVDAESSLWWVLLGALLAARAGYVWQFGAAYLAAPLSVVDIRDGGWSPTAGIAAACGVAWRLATLHPPQAPALRWATATGIAVFVAGSAAAALRGLPPTPLPGVVLATPDGAAVRLSDFAGKPAVVNLWASWCPPCRREMPLLQQAQAAHPEAHFVFVNQGEPPATVRRWISHMPGGLRNVVVDERRSVGAAFGESALPTTLFFDARGRLVAMRIGELSLATLGERLALATSGSR